MSSRTRYFLIGSSLVVVVGLWHSHLVHIPLTVSAGVSKRLDPESELWMSVLALTGQEKL